MREGIPGGGGDVSGSSANALLILHLRGNTVVVVGMIRDASSDEMNTHAAAVRHSIDESSNCWDGASILDFCLWRALHQERGEAPSLKHAAASGNKQWCHHHRPTRIRNEPREDSAGKATLQKPGKRGRKQSPVVGWFLPSKLPWKCSVMERCWSTVIHCGQGNAAVVHGPARTR